MNHNYIFYAYIDADRFFFLDTDTDRFGLTYVTNIVKIDVKLTNQICILSFQRYIRSFDQFEKCKVKYSLNNERSSPSPFNYNLCYISLRTLQ